MEPEQKLEPGPEQKMELGIKVTFIATQCDNSLS